MVLSLWQNRSARYGKEAIEWWRAPKASYHPASHPPHRRVVPYRGSDGCPLNIARVDPMAEGSTPLTHRNGGMMSSGRLAEHAVIKGAQGDPKIVKDRLRRPRLKLAGKWQSGRAAKREGRGDRQARRQGRQGGREAGREARQREAGRGRQAGREAR